MNKVTTTEIILYAVQYFVTIGLLIAAAIVMNCSGDISGILVGLGYIVYSVSQAIRVHGKDSYSLTWVGLFALALGIVTLAIKIGDKSTDEVIGIVVNCIAGILTLIWIVLQPMLSQTDRYNITKFARKTLRAAYRLTLLFVIPGTILSLLSPIIRLFVNENFNFNFGIISAVGFALLFAIKIYEIYIMKTKEYEE